MIALATFALLASSGDAFSISNGRMRSDTSLQMAGSKKKIVITGILMHILAIAIVIVISLQYIFI